MRKGGYDASVPNDQPRFAHDVLAVVLQVRAGQLQVLLWQRAEPPFAGRWALPGGPLAAAERLGTSLSQHLAAKVDLTDIAHMEQLETRSDPERDPRERIHRTREGGGPEEHFVARADDRERRLALFGMTRESPVREAEQVRQLLDVDHAERGGNPHPQRGNEQQPGLSLAHPGSGRAG